MEILHAQSMLLFHVVRSFRVIGRPRPLRVHVLPLTKMGIYTYTVVGYAREGTDVDEEDARLALLQTELNSLQASIRSLDSISIQIKGWCVTASLAIGGFAVTNHQPALILVGEGAVAGFFLINCQFRMFQRSFMNRNLDIDSELKKVGIMQVLRGAGTFDIVGTAAWLGLYGGSRESNREPFASRVGRNLPDFWFEATRGSNFSLYLFLAFCLFIEFVILLL